MSNPRARKESTTQATAKEQLERGIMPVVPDDSAAIIRDAYREFGNREASEYEVALQYSMGGTAESIQHGFANLTKPWEKDFSDDVLARPEIEWAVKNWESPLAQALLDRGEWLNVFGNDDFAYRYNLADKGGYAIVDSAKEMEDWFTPLNMEGMEWLSDLGLTVYASQGKPSDGFFSDTLGINEIGDAFDKFVPNELKATLDITTGGSISKLLDGTRGVNDALAGFESMGINNESAAEIWNVGALAGSLALNFVPGVGPLMSTMMVAAHQGIVQGGRAHMGEISSEDAFINVAAAAATAAVTAKVPATDTAGRVFVDEAGDVIKTSAIGLGRIGTTAATGSIAIAQSALQGGDLKTVAAGAAANVVFGGSKPLMALSKSGLTLLDGGSTEDAIRSGLASYAGSVAGEVNPLYNAGIQVMELTTSDRYKDATDSGKTNMLARVGYNAVLGVANSGTGKSWGEAFKSGLVLSPTGGWGAIAQAESWITPDYIATDLIDWEYFEQMLEPPPALTSPVDWGAPHGRKKDEAWELPARVDFNRDIANV